MAISKKAKKDEKSKKPSAKEVKGKEVNSKKKTLTPEQEEKKKARMEALKSRPEGQRTNSKQIDVIEFEGGMVETYGYALRKAGVLVTTVVKDSKGNPVGVSTEYVPGVKVKSKKGHGYIQPGVAGAGKNKSEEDPEDDGEE